MGNLLKQLLRDFAKADRRLLLLDYDGTLVPLQAHPSLAKPTAPVLALLQQLAENPKNAVVIISGRDQQALETWLGHIPLTFIAEHGSFVKTPDQTWDVLVPHNTDWKASILPFMSASVGRIPGSHVEKKSTGLVWHYRQADQGLANGELAILTAQLAPLIQTYDLTSMAGQSHLEVRIKGANKGAAAALLAGQNQWEFILAIGDEPTDEDMFKALPKAAFTLKVGPGATAANLHLANTADCLNLLTKLTAL